jgi:DNA-binding beta-propeller fold protein YncE
VWCLSAQVRGEWQCTVGFRGDQPGPFNEPRGLTLTPDEEFLLMVDGGNHRVAVLRSLDGAWVRQLTGPPGTLRDPVGVTVVPSTGEVLVSDYGRQLVIRFRSIDDDTVVGTLLGTGYGSGSGPTEFYGPRGLAVLDGVNCPVVCIYFDFRPYFTCCFYVCDDFHDTFPFCVSTCNGFFSQEGPVVVVVDCRNHRLVLLRLGDGAVWKQLGSKGRGPGQFIIPMAVAVTSTGALVVTDEYRVQVLTVDGAVLGVLDPTAVAGVGQLGQYLNDVTVCADSDEILVTDRDHHRVVALTWLPPSQVYRFPFYVFDFKNVFSHFYSSCFAQYRDELCWGAGCCRSVGGRAGLEQPGSGARATHLPDWCGGHAVGGRVGRRSLQSSSILVALIGAADNNMHFCFFCRISSIPF